MKIRNIKSKLKEFTPWTALYAYRKIRSVPEDLPVLIAFLFSRTKVKTSFGERLNLIYQCYRISYFVDCPHMEYEMLRVIAAVLGIEPGAKGVIVEAGAYKGGSGAKISRAAALAKRRLYIFDSFEGIPEHSEKHGKNIYDGDAYFPAGSYKGTLEEVKMNIGTYGKIEQCEFIQGWFEDTMPAFKEPIAAAYLDVDLESSTRTCLLNLYPLLVERGIIFSQDGHLPWIINLLRKKEFWEKEIKTPMPRIKGLGREKLLEIRR